MEPRLLALFIWLFAIHCAVSAKRYGGGGGSRISSGSVSRPRPSWSSPSPSRTSFDRPSSTSFGSGRTSSSNFLHAESGRPSLPANAYHPPSGPTYSHAPTAPVLPSNAHTANYGRPSSTVAETHQQSSSTGLQNNPYGRQPAYNPSFTATHSNPPYPVNLPNHPHPSSIGSSSYPSNAGFHPPMSAGYHPPMSAGYHPPMSAGYQPPMSAGYHPPMSAGYHPGVSAGYHPGVSAGYHPGVSAGYHPGMSAGYHPGMSAGYHPPTNGAYHPGMSEAPGRTVYVVPDSRGKSSGPGIGTYIASGVAGGVAAGATNAIVDHAISSIFRPNSHGVHTYPSAPAPGTPTTSITNNYYYANGAAAAAPTSNAGQPDQANSFNGQPAQVAPSQYVPPANGNQGTLNSAPVSGGSVVRPNNGLVNGSPDHLAKPDDVNFISDDELMKLSEDFFDHLNTNINQYVELNVQKRVAGNIDDGNIPDEAQQPLFIVKTGLDSIPTVSKLKTLYDHYQRNISQKEIVTTERQNKESAFLDQVMKTPVMKKALNWLSDKHYVKANEYDQKELLTNMWFKVFNDTSSGFERTFLSEIIGEAGISGMQNWIYFAHLEGKNMVNYMGYSDMLSLSGRGALLRINFKLEGITMQSVPIFIGTPPELELALYTICMHARFNGYCPISLGGAKFYIYTLGHKQNNNYLLENGFPLF